MTKMQLAKAKREIKQHYSLNRLPTKTEVDAEIAMVKRHKDNMTMDDTMLSLYCRLITGANHSLTL